MRRNVGGQVRPEHSIAMPKTPRDRSNRAPQDRSSRKKQPVPKKNWVFTVNNYTDADLAIYPLPSAVVKYCKYGKEVGETGTPHLQGYLQLWKPFSLLQVRALFNPEGSLSPPHFEAQLSPSNKVADDYCSKEDPNPFVQGTLTLSANELRQRDSVAVTRREVYASLRRGDPIAQIADDHPEEISYLHTIARYGKPRVCRAKVLYLHGTTGCGKTTSTTNVLIELGVSWHKKMPACHWFDGYIGQQVLVLEEFQSCFPLVSFLSLCDSYPPPLQIKGGTMPNQSDFIIICSNSTPLQQYLTVQEARPASFAAFLRRLDVTVDCSGLSHESIESTIKDFLGHGTSPDTILDVEAFPFSELIDALTAADHVPLPVLGPGLN